MVAHYKTLLLSQLVILIALLSVGCVPNTADIRSEEEASPLIQDLNYLGNSNGKIIKQEKLGYGQGCSDVSDCYRVRYSSDGLEVVGFIVKPKEEAQKFPVIIFNRGGNREFGKLTKNSLKYLSYLSSNGYVVLASQYRGNDGGQGREEFGGNDVNDVFNLIPLANSLSFVDANNVVMLGFSRGGMMTYIAIKHGIKIRAAAVVGGVTDLGQMYSERDEGMKNVIRELVGTDKSEWKKRSAYYWPDKLNVPVIILHGGKDWRVKVSQAKKLSEKLKEHGKEHKLAIFAGGDHGLNTHRGERNRMIFEWFNSHIQK